MERAAIVTAGALLVLALAAGSAGAVSTPKYITDAVADSARPEADKARDAQRKPAQTLEAAGVKPGDQVVELVPGKGYYTRLLSVVVGPRGKVYAIAPPPRPDAAPDAPAPAAAVQAIAADPHYANVKVDVQRAAELKLPHGVDVVWTTQNYHDFHNLKDTDALAIDKAVFNALRPDGTYFVVDHAATPGSGFKDTSTLHRVDEDAVKKEIESVGFRLVGESDALHNKEDPHTAKVFDESIRGHTDQFILIFRKKL
jgi:predicted methyltransferase